MVGTKAELEARYQVPGTIRADQLDDLDVGFRWVQAGQVADAVDVEAGAQGCEFQAKRG